MDRPPAQPPHLAAAMEAILARLLSDDVRFRSSEAVGQQLAASKSTAELKAVATEARKAKRVIGAWDGEKYRYPAFQFDDFGHPLPDIPALIAVLPQGTDGSGRAAVLWLFAPNGALGGCAPAEVFQKDPVRVLARARQLREGGPG